MKSISEPLHIINEDGRSFSIRLLRKNDTYGDDSTLTYESEEPGLEFFDTTGVNEEEPDALGYFTGIRCVVSDLFTEVTEIDSPLTENLSMWNISEDDVISIQNWLIDQLAEEEKKLINLSHIMFEFEKRRRDNNFYYNKELNLDLENIEFSTLSEKEENDEAIDLLDSTPFSERPVGTGFVQQELEAAIQALDLAEDAESKWKNGMIETRLHILSAKTEILKAIAVLNENKVENDDENK